MGYQNYTQMNDHQKILENRKRLPVYKYKDQFFAALESNQCILLAGETGSGKTTQVPQWCVEYLQKKHPNAKNQLKVVCTQPRRIAALNVARRVAEEMNVKLGTTVGYAVRFDNCTSNATRLKFVTDGLLLRNLKDNTNFGEYEVVILDEIHERSLSTDIILGFLKGAINTRPDLKIIIMSATFNPELFRNYFRETSLSVLQIPGRTFNVTISYAADTYATYLDLARDKVVEIHKNEPEGDILVFLTGEKEIESFCHDLRMDYRLNEFGTLEVLPLYSKLSSDDQQKILKQRPLNKNGLIGRKCIVSTNIAETSITIDGIVYVIDSGYSTVKVFSSERSMDIYKIMPISKASADQRKGRAGRTSEGKCFRLYTEEFYNRMDDQSKPEILTCSLNSLVLLLTRLGANVANFDYLTSPDEKDLINSIEVLYYLGAVDIDGNLTEEGRLLHEFPIEPTLAKMLISSSGKYGCSNEILKLVSMLSVPSVFYVPQSKKKEAEKAHATFNHPDGDHLTLINIFDSFIEENRKNSQWCYQNFFQWRFLKQAVDIKYQLEKIMQDLKLNICSIPKDHDDYSVNVRKSVLAGCFMQIVFYCKKSCGYIDVKSGTKDIKASGLIKNAMVSDEWLVYFELMNLRCRMVKIISPVEFDWLFEVAGHYYNRENFAAYYDEIVSKEDVIDQIEINVDPENYKMIEPSMRFGAKNFAADEKSRKDAKACQKKLEKENHYF